MATASVTYSFQPETDILSSEVNTNFSNLVNFLNANVIQKDASLAFTNIPSGPATNPTSANQFTRKAYVDAEITAGVARAVNVVKHLTSSSTGTSIGQNFVIVTGLTTTYDFTAGRLYRITGHVGLKMRTGGTGYIISVLEGGSELKRIAADLNYAGQIGRIAQGSWMTSSLSGSHTLSIGARTNVGELDYLGTLYGHYMTIEDLGVAP